MTIPRDRFPGPSRRPTIDHASREPVQPDDLSDGPPDDPRAPFDLRPLVYQAVTISGGQSSRTFTSESFAVVVAKRFDVRERPDGAWCARVLMGEAYVSPVEGRPGLWRVRLGG